jgi:lysophospholipase L1-like esterase
VERNQVALELMKKHGVVIDDLFTAITPRTAEYQRPNDVHFTDAGYDFLGLRVAESIESVLKTK